MSKQGTAGVRQPGVVQGAALILPITMAVMGVSALTAVIPQMEDHFGKVPHHQYIVPILMTVPAVWILLFSPIAGWLADHMGRRRILIAAMLVYAFVGTMPTYLEGIFPIFLSRCGVGICESVVLTVSTTMLSDYFKGRARERWLAAQTAFASLASLIIIPVGGLLGSLLGWRGPFYLYSYSLLLVVVVALFTWEPDQSDRVAEDLEAAADAFYQRMPWGRVASLCSLSLVAAVFFYTVITQNGNALFALGVTDPSRIGLYTTLCSIALPLGSFLYGRYAARFDIGYLVCCEFALIGGGFLLMSQAGSPAEYTAYAAINQFGCGMVLPTMLVWTTRGLAYSIRGLGTGLWQGSFTVGQFATALVIPFLCEWRGSLDMAFSAVGTAAMIISGCALGATRISRRY